jgi:hypothetical protein
MIFQGLTSRSLLPLNDGQIACEESSWHVTFTSNHWSTLATCKEFVDKILSSYKRSQIKELGLPNYQEMIWLIDCWSVHISQELRTWMKNKHPQIHLFFIPANCTLVFQPADVILQRPFKHAFQLKFNKYTMDVFIKQLEDRVDLKVDMKMSILKSKICGWVYKVWEHLTCKEDMVKKGWGHIGLLQAFQQDFQRQAMMENIKDPLFINMGETNASEEIDHTDMEEICAKVFIDTVLEDSLLRVFC